MLQDNRRDARRQSLIICQLDCVHHNYQRNPEEGESQSGQIFMERTELEMGPKGQGGAGGTEIYWQKVNVRKQNKKAQNSW